MTSKERTKQILAAFAILLLFVTTFAFLSHESVAWFGLKRSISTPTAIALPPMLDIRGKDHSEIEGITLSELDTEEGGSAQFLFCICGEAEIFYTIELAHTTNEPFRYRIFPARETAASPGASWVEYTAEETEGSYYYNPDAELTMSYLNVDEVASTETSLVALSNDYYYGKVYSGTDDVHSAAMPLFALSDPVESNPGLDLQFIDYYVLQVSWDESLQSKEVDMVYLLAQVAHIY